MTIPPLGSREEIPALLDSLGLIHRGVELGVDTGYFSGRLLAGCKVERLFSIDPWLAPVGQKWQDGFSTLEEYEMTLALLRPYGLRSIILKMMALEAVLLFADESLDFVYIDTSHRYESTRDEIAAWWPCIRPGGLLMGHDWDFCPGVNRAVTEFATAHGLEIATTQLDQLAVEHNNAEVRSWLIQKS